MDSSLNETDLQTACRKLAQTDPDLGFIFKTHGYPPLWARKKGFATLVRIILEQQVSLASAKAAFDKLTKQINDPSPDKFLLLNDAELKKIGFSRQKTRYVRGLAGAVVNGEIDLTALENMPDPEARRELLKIKGIGKWTSDIYLLMVLLRPDIMPTGDLALHAAWQKLKNLRHRPASDEFAEVAKKWIPYRSTAARLLWHFYLCEKVSTVSPIKH